jgi:hypothetical protein
VKNIVKLGRSQMILCHMHISCWITKAANMLRIGLCNIYCFPMATVVASTRLCVMFMHTLPVLFISSCVSHSQSPKCNDFYFVIF